MMAKVRNKLLYLLFRQRWNLAVTPHPAEVVAGLMGRDKQQSALDDLIWMEEDPAGFAADPFIQRLSGGDDTLRVFFEFYPWKTSRGRIDCVDFHAGSFGKRALALDSPHHLSYPFLLQKDGEWAMMPEHAQAKDLSFYRLGDDGSAIEKQTIGGNLELIDSTIVEHGGIYYLFATHPGSEENAVLHIYFSNDVAGPWQIHPLNPVKRDTRNARPAGQFIRFGDEIFRPAQDCKSHYGSRIVINRVAKLSKTEFEEETVSEIAPNIGWRYNFGLHTISSSGDFTVIDGGRLESTIHPSFDRLSKYFHPWNGKYPVGL